MVWAVMMWLRWRGSDGRDADKGPGAGYRRLHFLIGDGGSPRSAGDPILAGNPLPGLSLVIRCARPRSAFYEAAAAGLPGRLRVAAGDHLPSLAAGLRHESDADRHDGSLRVGLPLGLPCLLIVFRHEEE